MITKIINICDYILLSDRTTATGEIINNYLNRKLNFSLETAHMLFSANRWECKDEILKSLYSGNTIVIDR